MGIKEKGRHAVTGLFKMAFYMVFDTFSLNGAAALSNPVFQRALCFTFHRGMKSSIKIVVFYLMNLCTPAVLEKFYIFLLHAQFIVAADYTEYFNYLVQIIM